MRNELNIISKCFLSSIIISVINFSWYDYSYWSISKRFEITNKYIILSFISLTSDSNKYGRFSKNWKTRCFPKPTVSCSKSKYWNLKSYNLMDYSISISTRYSRFRKNWVFFNFCRTDRICSNQMPV